MGFVAKTFGVDLVDVLGAGGPRGEPTALRADLDAADGRLVSGRGAEYLVDPLAGKLGGVYLRAVELAQFLLLLRGGARFDAIRERLAQVLRELAIDFGRIVAAARGGLGPEHCPRGA